MFGGLGDPLLRLPELLEISKLLKEEKLGFPMRVTTNGLVDRPEEVGSLLLDAGIRRLSDFILFLLFSPSQEFISQCSASVALNASSQDEYEDFMLSPPSWDVSYMHESPRDALGELDSTLAFPSVCSSIAVWAELGLSVTATCVGRPDVDVSKVRNLALSLGAEDFKERSWLS